MGSGETLQNTNVVFRITGKGLAWYILPLPSLAFIACVVLSIVYDFKSSTATHCGVCHILYL